jgi:hypothetical protein
MPQTVIFQSFTIQNKKQATAADSPKPQIAEQWFVRGFAAHIFLDLEIAQAASRRMAAARKTGACSGLAA